MHTFYIDFQKCTLCIFFHWKLHNFVAGSGLKASTATPSSPILRQSSRSSWLWLNWFFRSILLILFILEDNLPFLVFKKGIVTISLIRCKILLQSSFTFMHRKTFCHTSKYLILLLPWFLMIRTTCVFNLNGSLVAYNKKLLKILTYIFDGIIVKKHCNLC